MCASLSHDPPALGFPEPPNVSLRLISARYPFFLGSDGRRSPRRVRVSFHIMVTSLQRVWSVADVSTDVRATLGSSSCFSAEPFVGTLVGGVGGWGGFGFRGGCNYVLSTFLTVFVILQHATSNIQHALDAMLWHFFLQHLTRAWCYAVTLRLATSNCAWQDRAPQFVVRALLEQGAWLGTRSSSSCRTQAKSVKWINKSIAMLPETFVELVTAVKSAKKGDYQLLGRCGKHILYWYLQWILMDLHFPWRSQGFCIIILITMYGHLIKSATLPRNLLLPFFKTNTFC